MMSVDIAILGSGFASSLCASILAKNGRSVAIIDRGRHPRFAIGESTTPAADFLLHHLAVQYQLPELIPLTKFGSWVEQYPSIRCGCKRGFSYVWHGNGNQYAATTNHDNELMVTANSSREVADTQWYRPDVDTFFLQVAKTYGAIIIEEANLDQVSVDHKGGHLIDYSVHGEPNSINSSFVIDGSGPNSVFMQRWGGDDWTHRLLTNTSAVYGHFEGGQVTEAWLTDRKAVIQDFPYPFDQAAVHHLFHDGWLWQIGFDDGLTSLGFVTNHRSNHLKNSLSPNSFEKQSSEFAFDRWTSILTQHPVLRNLYGNLNCSQFPGRLFHLPRLQRLRATAAGPNWAALSFTAGFIDPLHSTGIAHTLSTVERICNILIGPHKNQRPELLQEYSDQLVEELMHIDQIIATCYSSLCHFELFTASTMVYFAAAIALERHRGLNLKTGFLLARDMQFRSLVETVHGKVTRLSNLGEPPPEREVADLISCIKSVLKPYDNVGLFTPSTRNMILHTTATK